MLIRAQYTLNVKGGANRFVGPRLLEIFYDRAPLVSPLSELFPLRCVFGLQLGIIFINYKPLELITRAAAKERLSNNIHTIRRPKREDRAPNDSTSSSKKKIVLLAVAAWNVN